MKQGRMKCIGTSLELKNRFGLGYKLTIVKSVNTDDNKQLDQFLRDSFPRDSCVLLQAYVVLDFLVYTRTRAKTPALAHNIVKSVNTVGS